MWTNQIWESIGVLRILLASKFTYIIIIFAVSIMIMQTSGGIPYHDGRDLPYGFTAPQRCTQIVRGCIVEGRR
jgi:hypothetical protein